MDERELAWQAILNLNGQDSIQFMEDAQAAGVSMYDKDQMIDFFLAANPAAPPEPVYDWSKMGPSKGNVGAVLKRILGDKLAGPAMQEDIDRLYPPKENRALNP